MDTKLIWAEEQGLIKKLYRNVTNTAQIRKLIFSAKLPFTLLNPKLIVDPFQVSVAVTKALFNVKEGKMTTRSLPTEIIYSLSPSKNISDSLKIFSAQDTDTELFIIGEKALFTKIGEQIQGQEVPLDQLHTFTNIDLVKQVYQIGEEELNIEESSNALVDAVVSRMASKEYSNISWSNVPNNNNNAKTVPKNPETL